MSTYKDSNIWVSPVSEAAVGLTQLTLQTVTYILWSMIYMQTKAVGYFQNIFTLFAPVGLSCLTHLLYDL